MDNKKVLKIILTALEVDLISKYDIEDMPSMLSEMDGEFNEKYPDDETIILFKNCAFMLNKIEKSLWLRENKGKPTEENFKIHVFSNS